MRMRSANKSLSSAGIEKCLSKSLRNLVGSRKKPFRSSVKTINVLTRYFVYVQDAWVHWGARKDGPAHPRPGQEEQPLGREGQMHHHVGEREVFQSAIDRYCRRVRVRADCLPVRVGSHRPLPPFPPEYKYIQHSSHRASHGIMALLSGPKPRTRSFFFDIVASRHSRGLRTWFSVRPSSWITCLFMKYNAEKWKISFSHSVFSKVKLCFKW